MRLREKHKLLEELANQNKAENNDAIRGVRVDINSLLYHEEGRGDNGHGPFGFLQVIRTPNSFINGQANGDEKITL